MTPIFFDSNHDDNTRLKNLYSGAIYVFSPTPSGIALQDFAAEFCKDYFQTQSPTTVQHELPVSEFIETLKRLKPEFIHHPSCKKLIANILSDLNCDQKTTYFDVPRIRTACAGDYLSSGLAYAFKPHRDTWYSTPDVRQGENSSTNISFWNASICWCVVSFIVVGDSRNA